MAGFHAPVSHRWLQQPQGRTGAHPIFVHMSPWKCCAVLPSPEKDTLQDSGRPRNVLALDYDWTAPGLTYMLSAHLLPQGVQVVQKPATTTTDVLCMLDETVRQHEGDSPSLRQSSPQAKAFRPGIGRTRGSSLEDLLDDLPRQLGVIERRDEASLPDSPAEKGSSEVHSRLYYLPALAISNLMNAVRVFTFEQRVLGGQILKDPKAAEINQWDPYFAWIQRALLAFS